MDVTWPLAVTNFHAHDKLIDFHPCCAWRMDYMFNLILPMRVSWNLSYKEKPPWSHVMFSSAPRSGWIFSLFQEYKRASPIQFCSNLKKNNPLK